MLRIILFSRVDDHGRLLRKLLNILPPSVCGIFRSDPSGIQHCGREEGAGSEGSWTPTLPMPSSLKSYSGLTLSIIWIISPLQISFINQTFLINNNNKIIKFLLFSSLLFYLLAAGSAARTAVTQRRGGRRWTSRTTVSAVVVWLPSPPPFLSVEEC